MSLCITSPRSDTWKRRVTLKKSVPLGSSPAQMSCTASRPDTCQSPPRSSSWSPVASTKTVSFDPINLERVCFFYTAQTPSAIQDQVKQQQQQIEYIHWPVCKGTKCHDNRTIWVEREWQLPADRSKIKGNVLVHNLALEKSVVIRYTTDGWKTLKNVDAVYRGHHDRSHDAFTFTLDLPRHRSGCTLHFAVCYRVAGQEFWENNGGQNYAIQIGPSHRVSPRTRPALTAPRPRPILAPSSPSPPPTLPSPAVLSSAWQWSPPAVQAAPHCLPRADLDSPAYLDLVNRYCFYSTSTARPPMTING